MKVAKSKSNESGFCNGISALIGGWSLNRYEHICNKLLIGVERHAMRFSLVGINIISGRLDIKLCELSFLYFR